MLMWMVAGIGMAKKSRMDPQLLETVSRDLNRTAYAVINSRGMCVNHGFPYSVTLKDAGETKISWEQFGRGHSSLKLGDIVVLDEVKPKKWGFRITFRTLEKRKFKTTKIDVEKRTVVDKETEEETEIEIEREKDVTAEAHFRIRIDYKFNERRHTFSEDNLRFIHDTFAQGFTFFKTKEEALVYVDEEIGSDNSVEIGMTVAGVVKILGIPKKKLKAGNKMIYKYDEWVIHFTDGKVTEVEF